MIFVITGDILMVLGKIYHQREGFVHYTEFSSQHKVYSMKVFLLVRGKNASWKKCLLDKMPPRKNAS